MAEWRARRRLAESFGIRAVLQFVTSGEPSSEAAAELWMDVDQLNARAVERLLPAPKSFAAQQPETGIGCSASSARWQERVCERAQLYQLVSLS